jgi:hypothetical protein
MRSLENLKLPRWTFKSINPGEEDDFFTSLIVGFLAFYTVGVIVYFAMAPLGREHIILDVFVALAILAVIVFGCWWLIAQAALLRDLRREAKVCYNNSTTEKVKEEAKSRLEFLSVSLEQLDAIAI